MRYRTHTRIVKLKNIHTKVKKMLPTLQVETMCFRNCLKQSSTIDTATVSGSVYFPLKS